jgi:hypothetical protein
MKSFSRLQFLTRRRIEAGVFLLLFFIIFGFLGSRMGTANLINTIMATSYDLLLKTVLYIMAITVLSGALSRLLIEFGVVRLLEYIFSPLMRPIYNLPGVAALGGIMTFFSDNPAIIGLLKDKNFNKYFKPYQLVSLTNFGTAFGMGLVVLTFMTSLGYFTAALVGVAGAAFGGMVSTRLMQYKIKNSPYLRENKPEKNTGEVINFKSEGSIFLRFLNAILDGGKTGVELGLAIIPGVLIISTLVMILTFGPSDPSVGYQGLAYEGVRVLPWIAGKLSWLFEALFGFQHPELIAFPITSLGAVGAALGLVKQFIAAGYINGNVVAVFTGMGMCWSGFLSTYTAMYDSIGYRGLLSKGLVAQTIGGICAGVFAHWLYVFLSLFFTV